MCPGMSMMRPHSWQPVGSAPPATQAAAGPATPSCAVCDKPVETLEPTTLRCLLCAAVAHPSCMAGSSRASPTPAVAASGGGRQEGALSPTPVNSSPPQHPHGRPPSTSHHQPSAFKPPFRPNRRRRSSWSTGGRPQLRAARSFADVGASHTGSGGLARPRRPSLTNAPVAGTARGSIRRAQTYAHRPRNRKLALLEEEEAWRAGTRRGEVLPTLQQSKLAKAAA